jgi:CopG family nickel-responsive transcriptional regulator
MGNIIRFGVSIEENLLQGFDALIESKGYANRSEAIRHLIRNLLLETRIEEEPEAEVIGTITLIYDHSQGDLANRLMDIQHSYHHHIISTLHVHIDEENCLEVLAVKGQNSQIRRISDFLIGARGVQHGKLIIHHGTGGHTDGTAGGHTHGGHIHNDRTPGSHNHI